MRIEEVNCYICGEGWGEVWGEENGFQMIKCAGCGLVYLPKRPSSDEIDRSAQTGMHKFGSVSLNVVGLHSHKKVRDYSVRLKALLPEETWSKASVSWLDVGAGHGELVEAVKGLCAVGSTVRGIEPCLPKVKNARARGLNVDATPLEDVHGQFSHVSLINVYSHLPYPVQFLEEVRRLLLPSGELILATGNGGEVKRSEVPGALYLPDHLSFVSEDNLRWVLNRAGFQVVNLKRFPVELDSAWVCHIKNVARRIVGRPVRPHTLPPGSRACSLWSHSRGNE